VRNRVSIHDRVKKVIQIFCGFLLMGGILVNFSDIIARNIAGRSIPWAQQITVWCVIMVSFLVMGLLIKDGTHISVEFIYAKLTGISKKIMTFIHSLVIAFVSCFLLIGGISLVISIYDRGTQRGMGTWQAPLWIVYLACMVIGLAIAAVYGIYMLIRAFKDFAK